MIDQRPFSDRGHAERRLSAMAPGTMLIAHDLGNLLQIVASAVRLIDRSAERAPSVDLRPLAQTALGAIDRATILASQILYHSEPIIDDPEAICLATTLRAIRDLVQLAAGPNVRVEFSADADAPRVACDRQEFENATLNLVSNASHAMPDGGHVRISVCGECDRPSESATSDDDRRFAVVSVIDDGTGMAPDIVSRALRPRFTTRLSGHGLGLAMVEGFVRRSGGTVEILSNPGRGTTVMMRLPAATISPTSETEVSRGPST